VNLKDMIKHYQPSILKMNIHTLPIQLYEILYQNEPFSFLYESLEGKEKRGRYSFLGGNPFLLFQSRGDKIDVRMEDQYFEEKGNPFDLLKNLTKGFKHSPPVLPFSGGALGYIAYDAIRYVEDIPDTNPDDFHMPDIYFMFPSEIIVFDHLENSLDIIVFSKDDGEKRLRNLKSQIKACCPEESDLPPSKPSDSITLKPNMTKEEYVSIVQKAKEYILAGDIFQVVLSQRIDFEIKETPLSVFKALRKTNPSPYMYFLNLEGLNVLGSSPEILVKLTHGTAVTRPLAGTRPRGETPEEDDRLEKDLLSDEKERAEHVMLVDLSRSDMGRVCQHGSVRTTHLFEVERYSKVMHIVSHIVGEIDHQYNSFDLLESTFPAGTVSGAPKIRAMEIIDELEPTRRGIYAGAIGYFGFNGDMDFCIAIRMILMKDSKGYIQAGAGIVADSDPEKEYQETLNKAMALFHAIQTKGAGK